jgi:type IV pilus assembly protein PilC
MAKLKQKPREKKLHKSFFNIGLGKERDYLVENLSMLVASGMPILEAIAAVGAETKSRRIKKLVAEMSGDIEAGLSFSKTLEHSGLFSAQAVALIRIGEESGRLSENLKVLAVEETKERELKSKLRSAMMYPVFVLSLTVIIGTGIAWFILPKLATVFNQLRLDLPLVTKILIVLGTFLGRYGFYVVPIFLAVLVILIYFIFIFSKTKSLGQTILFSLPGIREMMKEIELARFGYLLGTLLSAGILVTEALDSLARATALSRYRVFYQSLKQNVAEGNSFKKSFSLYSKINKLIPIPIQQLIMAGEKSGNLPETLLKIGHNYEERTEITTKNLTIVLEPILLVIVWLGVVAVALAVILPIYNLIGGLNTNP